mmetsp:Transcript_89344/g.288880  ORF Transcript_89344/g.288880 Transcript_89344/m.288880 type:complete len:284 (-) Transcript_89344:744-1595(-)
MCTNADQADSGSAVLRPPTSAGGSPSDGHRYGLPVMCCPEHDLLEHNLVHEAPEVVRGRKAFVRPRGTSALLPGARPVRGAAKADLEGFQRQGRLRPHILHDVEPAVPGSNRGHAEVRQAFLLAGPGKLLRAPQGSEGVGQDGGAIVGGSAKDEANQAMPSRATPRTSVKPHERRPEAATARQTSSPMTAFSRPNVVSAPPGIVASAGAAAELEDAEEAVLEAAFWAAATEEATVRTSSQASSSRNSVPPTTSSLSLLPAFPLCPPFTNRPRRVVPRPVSRLP